MLLLQCCDVAVLQLCGEHFVILDQVSVALSGSVSYCKRLTVLITQQKTVVKFLMSLQQICLFPLYRLQYLPCPSSFILNTQNQSDSANKEYGGGDLISSKTRNASSGREHLMTNPTCDIHHILDFKIRLLGKGNLGSFYSY